MPAASVTPHGRAVALAAMLAVGTASIVVLAQDAPATVGALLDAGGKQLTKAEILSLFAGATINGTQMGRADATFQMKYLADGTTSGTGTVPAGSTKITGTWSANDQNQYCQDLRTAEGNPVKGCFPYFKLGDRLFAAPTEARNSAVFERRLSR